MFDFFPLIPIRQNVGLVQKTQENADHHDGDAVDALPVSMLYLDPTARGVDSFM